MSINTELILGFLALLQVIFLPGYLFLKLIKYKSNNISICILAFSLSMVINFFIVYLMTLLGIFTPFYIRILLLIELLFFFILIKTGSKQYSIKTFFNYLKTIDNYELIAVGLLIYAVIFAVVHLFSVFTGWDTICSWNPWAIEWFNGLIPKTGSYPQLIPANISIIYAIIGFPLQFFACFFWASILFFTLLIPYSIAKYDRNNKDKWILSVIGVLFFVTPLTNDVGYADLPVAFMGFVSFYPLLSLKFEKITGNSVLYKKIIVTGILTGGAAITKQAGGFILIVIPIILWLYIFYNNSKYNIKTKLTATLSLIIISLMIPASWYMYTYYTKIYSSNTSGLLALTWSGGFINLLKWAIIHKFKLLNFIILAISIIFTWKSKFCKTISILIVIPYFIIWLLCFGYDARNISILLPFAGILFGFTIHSIITWVSPYNLYLINKLKIILDFIALIVKKTINYTLNIPFKIYGKKIYRLPIYILFFILIIFCPLFSKENLLNFQNYRAITKIGGRKYSTVNKKIYQMIKKKEVKGNIFTNYALSTYLPVIGNKFIHIGSATKFPDDKYLKEHNIEYMLLTYLSSDDINKINKLIANNTVKTIFSYRKVYFLKIVNSDAK